MFSDKIKAGIVCDDYKVRKFKKDLKSHGYNDLRIKKQTGKLEGTTLIQVRIETEKVPELQKLIEEIELYFKALKN